MSASSAAAPLLRGSERGNSLNRQGWSLCDVNAVSLTLPFHNLSILEISLTCSAPSPVVSFWSRSAAAMSRLPMRKPDKTHRAEALQTPNASRQCGGPCPPLMCVGGTGTSHRSEALSPRDVPVVVASRAQSLGGRGHRDLHWRRREAGAHQT